MVIKDISVKMFMENGTFKNAEIIESILNSMVGESDEIELRVTGVTGLNYDSFDYYLLQVQTLARSKQEYLVEQSFSTVYGMYLICEEKVSHKRGLVYVSDNGTEVVLNVEYDDIDRIGNKIFQGFNEVGDVVKQVYDNGYEFVDFSDMYLHDILEFAGFKFYLVNNSATQRSNSNFIYIEVLGVDETNNDFTDEVEDIFILRNKSEFEKFFSELMEELQGVFPESEYNDIIDIKNDICSDLRT